MTLFRQSLFPAILCVVATVLLLAGCSMAQNTASTRRWKAFKARYNTYYNGHQAYLEGMSAKRTGVKDNYLQPLPLLMVGNENARKLGSGNFETAITKCEKTIQIYSIRKKPVFKRGHKLSEKEKNLKQQTEFNPFLKNAWLLLGMSQLQKGDFIDAASTFAYTCRIYRNQPEILNTARALQAVSYIESEWFYDAENLLDKVKRDGIPGKSRRYYNMAMADLLLKRKNWKEAAPYVEKEVKLMKRGREKARGYFLLAQTYKNAGDNKNAFKAFSKCKRQSPPYEMKISAQVAQTEVMASGGNVRQRKRLKSLARKTNNKKYLDQIYYALGNAFMAEKDTVQAIAAYEKGRKAEEADNNYARSMILVSLGDIYWEQERFSAAYDCYKDCIGSLSHSYENYDTVKLRSNVLGKLAPYTDEIFAQDSMQAMTRMTEAERNAIIDKAIELEKQRQKEAERMRRDSVRKARMEKMQGGRSEKEIPRPVPAINTSVASISGQSNNATWYFYDPATVSQGMALFKKVWGKRSNADNWRIDVGAATSKGLQSNRPDSLRDGDENESGKGKKKILDENDPENKLGRAYYLAQLPFTEEQMRESNSKLQHALYMAGLIEMDELENGTLARKNLTRLYRDFPQFEPKDFLLYKLFLLDLRWGSPLQAQEWKTLLVSQYPQSKYTAIISDEHFEEKARYGKMREDSLYACTYEAYRTNDYATLERNCILSEKEYPHGANRSKFLYLAAMNSLRKGELKEFASQMDSVSRYKEDPIHTIAENILNGIKAGRKPVGGSYSMEDFWESRRSLVGNVADSTLQADTLSINKEEPFLLILEYPTDRTKEGQLIYEVSRFNFTSFAIRNFEVSTMKMDTVSRIFVEEFTRYDEAAYYTQELYKDSTFRNMSKGIRPILVSRSNYKLLGTRYTMEEYLKFYRNHFVPLSVKRDIQLDTPVGQFIWDEFEEVPPAKEDVIQETGQDDDSGEWY